MKRMTTAIVLTVAMMLMAAPAGAHGQTADTLDNAGWNCFTAGPNDWTHCTPPSNASGSAQATNVKVFTADGHTFLGTEILLSAAVMPVSPVRPTAVARTTTSARLAMARTPAITSTQTTSRTYRAERGTY